MVFITEIEIVPEIRVFRVLYFAHKISCHGRPHFVCAVLNVFLCLNSLEEELKQRGGGKGDAGALALVPLH